MNFTRLGRTALSVSRLCLGTMNFGWVTPERDAFRIMDRAVELGINFFDTANIYGLGESERIIGRWLAQDSTRRDKVVLATKVHNQMSDWPNDGGLSARHIRHACDASLERLQTDHIDLYQMHHIDRAAPWDEIWQAMAQLVTSGKVIYVGSSNFAGWHIARANETARQHDLLGLVSEQSIYNLSERTLELEVLPACEAYGLAVLPWAPLAGGALAGTLSPPTEGRRANEHVRGIVERIRPQVDAYERVCAELGQSPADVALAWLLTQPAVTAPIIGPRTVEQLEASARAIELELDGDTLGRLDVVFPGPGGAAPEAYAW
jgi:aryl-alcohol dehydrogenase-like predicted oxidoreductase